LTSAEARTVKAWANGPGSAQLDRASAEGAGINRHDIRAIIPRFQRLAVLVPWPGPLAQALRMTRRWCLSP